MDRAVMLVDVGYLLAEGGKAYCGVNRRSQVHCDYAGAADALENMSTGHCALPLLRSYWYDGAPDYVPTQDHLTIAALPRVKLRLGRLVTGRKGEAQQKGVDSLIVHDLISLANERAVATAFLLAGDEDIREGVAAAQRLGVQVILLGIPTAGPNQSLPLIRESDEHVLLPDDLLRQFFQPAGYQPGAPAPLADQAKEDPKAAIAQAAATFAVNWIMAADLTQAGDLLAHEPRIPRELDVQLLIAAEEAAGLSLRGQEELRRTLRSAFWDEIKRRAKPRTETTDEGATEA